MPKQIIILDKKPNGNIRVAFWLAVPATRKRFFSDSTKISQWSGASVAENTDIQNGTIIEQVEEYGKDLQSNLAAAKTFLESEFTTKQAEITALNQWKFYGSFFENNVWTNGGVL